MRLRRWFVGGLSVVLLAGLLVSAPGAQLSQAEWEVVDELDSPVAGGQVVPLSNGRALLTGIVDRGDLRRVDLYDPAVGFRRVADAPAPLTTHFAATLLDGRVLVGGGGDFLDRNELTDRCFIYDPASDEWTEVAPLPVPTFYLYSNPAVTLQDGRVMVSGGGSLDGVYPGNLGDFLFDLYVASRRVFLFDPSSETWREGAPMPATRTFATHAPNFSPHGHGIPIAAPRVAGRTGHDTVLLPDGRVLVVGGREYAPGWFYGVSPLDIYDPRTDSWTRLAEMPGIPSEGDTGSGGRGWPAVSILGSGKVLIAGGFAQRIVQETKPNGSVVFVIQGSASARRSSLLFDPSTGALQRVGDLTERRAFSLGASQRAGGGAFVLGGSSINLRPMPVAEYFDPLSQTWYLLPPEPEPTSADYSPRKGALLSDGTVLTWSSLHFQDEPSFGGPGGMRTVKRLHPAGNYS